MSSPPARTQTLERSYLLRINNRVVERPQHMLMRVAVGIHKHDIPSALATYHLLSERWFTHASPTLFNAGTPRPQLSSCFLVCMKNDSIEARPGPAPLCVLCYQSGLALVCGAFRICKVSRAGPPPPGPGSPPASSCTIATTACRHALP